MVECKFVSTPLAQCFKPSNSGSPQDEAERRYMN